MNYRLKINPALEMTSDPIEFLFSTPAEMLAAKNTAASLLLYLQEGLGCMGIWSNIFVIEHMVDGKWEEYEVES